MHRVVSIGALVDSDRANSTGLSLDALITGVVNLCAFLLDKANSDELLQTTLSMYQGCARSEVAKRDFSRKGAQHCQRCLHAFAHGATLHAARRSYSLRQPPYCGCVFCRGSTGRGC